LPLVNRADQVDHNSSNQIFAYLICCSKLSAIRRSRIACREAELYPKVVEQSQFFFIWKKNSHKKYQEKIFFPGKKTVQKLINF